MITKETFDKIQEILKDNTDETASKLGVILTEVAIYMLENYQLTVDDIVNSLRKSIKIVEDANEQ